ncbi:MAG: aminotransferase [Prochlorococcus sp. SP3034]|nr:aminotransferase [Prochlorococcus sp. SP3034]|tara:strand:- start:6711 stop:7883 length:1173 start_codon:yes stop_codon:yes gene_type:complete
MDKDFIYFDHASTSPLSKNVLDTIINYNEKYWGNVSSTYQFGIDCAQELERLRTKIANLFNAKTEDIIFTSGASESISLVFNKISDKFLPGNITISAVEHKASLIASNRLKKVGWSIKEWPVDNEGIIKISEADRYINNNIKLVSIIWGQSEIGSIQPVQHIGKKCIDKEVLFHIDGTQIISNGIFNWNNLNCDLLSLSAHKFGGPKGIGILLTNNRSRKILSNPDISESHEYSIRAGTQPLPLISGLHKALENVKGRIILSDKDLYFQNKEFNLLSNYLIKRFSSNDKIQITGSINNRLPNHLSFILFNKDFIPIKAYKIINYMSDNNIAISSGSACSSNANQPSNILKKINLENNKLFSNIRLSFSIENNFNQLDRFYDLLLECIKIF